MGSFFIIFFQVIVIVLLLLFICVIIFFNIREINKWRSANKQPVISLPAKVLLKRSQVIHHLHQFEIHLYYPAYIYYFVSFQLENEDEMEMEVSGLQFKEISEGDTGILTFQGKELIGFAKDKKG